MHHSNGNFRVYWDSGNPSQGLWKKLLHLMPFFTSNQQITFDFKLYNITPKINHLFNSWWQPSSSITHYGLFIYLLLLNLLTFISVPYLPIKSNFSIIKKKLLINSCGVYDNMCIKTPGVY